MALLFAVNAAAQGPAADNPMSAPNGYVLHQSVDLGGRIANPTGSRAMYDSLVNLQSGPRVLGETFEMRALPGKATGPVDTISAFGSGFGGDPNNFARLNASKGKLYDFSGLFRRDRQYFDYDLLANPNIPSGQSIPIGASKTPTGSFAWPQVNQSPVLFNTVRRMTDTDLTLLPLSKFTYRFAYSQNIFQGPTLSPGGSSNFFAESIGANDALLQEFQRNSSDDFTGEFDWKPVWGTKLAFEEEIEHYKGDSYFTIAPSQYTVQEADGTPVAIGNWDSMTPYGISSCNTGSMGSAFTNSTTYTILSPAQTTGGLPIINAACDVVSSYLRSQPTRILFPTEMLRLQSTSIRNIAMNGDVRYTQANMSMPNYYESFAGLDGAIRSIVYTGNASAKRIVMAADYGIDWQTTKAFSISDQISYSNAHQPSTANISKGATLVTPGNPNNTITYGGTLNPGASGSVEGNPNGVPTPDYFGQMFLTNHLTGSWDVSARTTLSLTYRFSEHVIAQGIPHNEPLAVGSTSDGSVTINENGGILAAAVRPASNWDLNGSAELAYADNAFTPVGARQLQHYRVHTRFRAKPWATISGAYNDLERHNNTNNNQAAVAAGDDPYLGPLNHVDHSRTASVSATIIPNEHYGVDLSYAYSDVYTATNICYDNGAQNPSTVVSAFPGTASTNSAGGPNVCLGVYTRGSKTQLADWFARDFMNAPTQNGSVAVHVSPSKVVRTNLGYRVSSVDGNRFFNDARDVNGSLVSTYQSPFANVSWTARPGLVWKAEYNFYGYGEGGPSGPEFCSTSTSITSTVVPCTSLSAQTGLTLSPAGETAARNFHANNVTLSVHYEF